MEILTIHGDEHLTDQEKMALSDLIVDIKRVCSLEIREEQGGILSPGSHIVVGSEKTSRLVSELVNDGSVDFSDEAKGKGGGCIRYFKPDSHREVLVLAGYDPEGTQYALYDYCRKELGIDPFSFWTGSELPQIPDFELSRTRSRQIPAPLVPIRCYFDNDNDELANLTQPYLEIDFPYWKEMIDTLVRLRYNALDLHDHLGRVEYTTRKPYLELCPDYAVNEELVQKIIDYAKQKGMKIQVSFFLGWQFNAISDEASHNWKEFKQDWIKTWKYYLEETVIGQSDLFLNRPRDQRLDHPYRSSCGEDAVQVFNEAFAAMRDLIKAHNRDAVIIVDLYSEGMEAYRNGFHPEPAEDFILCWPDNGFGEFKSLPESLEPYRSGIYMHAGFWRNHLVQDPYPELLEKSMKEAFLERGMTEYCLVNGQTFRHFILNLEVCSELCFMPGAFDRERFLSQWIERYMGADRVREMKELLYLFHKGQEGEKGYIQIMCYISDWQSLDLLERSCEGIWKERLDACSERIALLTDGYERALALEKERGKSDFFHDHFILPFKLLLQLNRILQALLSLPDSENRTQDSLNLNELIEEHTQLRLSGDRDTRWKGWYDPETARPNGGYPRKEFWRNYH